MVLVEDEPPEDEPDDLLGLYDGVALTERDSTLAVQLPDRIFIFRGPLLDCCDTEEQLVEEVRITVVHEIAHHFGIDDRRLHELGYAWLADHERRPRTRRAQTPMVSTAYAVPRIGPEAVGLHRERGVRREAAAEPGAEQRQPVAGRAGLDEAGRAGTSRPR